MKERNAHLTDYVYLYGSSKMLRLTQSTMEVVPWEVLLNILLINLRVLCVVSCALNSCSGIHFSEIQEN